MEIIVFFHVILCYDWIKEQIINREYFPFYFSVYTCKQFQLSIFT